MEIDQIIKELNENPVEENWKKFAKALPKSKIKYYRIVYQKSSLKKAEDLRKSYAELYDKTGKLLFQVPIFMKSKKIEGSTIYLKSLLNINKW
ncbi:MAG: hypothetical protein ACP5RT_01240 [Candidatus Micrarchaeia archaeon]